MTTRWIGMLLLATMLLVGTASAQDDVWDQNSSAATSSTSSTSTTTDPPSTPPTTPSTPPPDWNAKAQELEGSAPPVPTVFDVTNAGVVFTQLREGVDAWRASLGATTDPWGNEISEGYMEARMPDFVNEALIAFLQDYYKDKGIVLVAGPQAAEATLASLQNDHNQKIVDELVRQQTDWETSHPPTPPSTGPEDVPELPPADDPPTEPTDPTSGAIQITSVSPNSLTLTSAPVDLTIAGEGFGTVASDNRVELSGSSGSLTVMEATSSSLSVRTGDGLVAGAPVKVVVWVGGVSSNEYDITLNPSVSSVAQGGQSTNSVDPTQTIEVKGAGFSSEQSGNQVMINGLPVTPTSISNTSLGLTPPAGITGSMNISVTVNGASSQTVSVATH